MPLRTPTITSCRDYNQHVFPLKLYDYMASGKPIVASAMEELLPLANDDLTIARDRHAWIPAIEAAIESDSPARVDARQREATAQSWDHRVEEISAIIQPLLLQHAAADAKIEARGQTVAG